MPPPRRYVNFLINFFYRLTAKLTQEGPIATLIHEPSPSTAHAATGINRKHSNFRTLTELILVTSRLPLCLEKKFGSLACYNLLESIQFRSFFPGNFSCNSATKLVAHLSTSAQDIHLLNLLNIGKRIVLLQRASNQLSLKGISASIASFINRPHTKSPELDAAG